MKTGRRIENGKQKIIMDKYKSEISGHLDIFVADYSEEAEGEDEDFNHKEVLIHGDPEGLRSLAKILNKIADLNQSNEKELPDNERFHIHLRPKFDLADSSDEVIIGRLDAKGTGDFYERYIPKEI